MASIEPKYGCDGRRSYRLSIRRKGAPYVSMTFDKLSDAQKFVDLYEDEYVKNPDTFDCKRMKLKMERGY